MTYVCEQCDKKLVRRSNEKASNYKKRRFCNQACINLYAKDHPRKPKNRKTELEKTSSIDNIAARKFISMKSEYL